jgi:serine/threonine protein kinase
VAAALDYAHAQAVVHRDIKPSNIVVRENTGRAVLMDFGIAKIAAETQLTQAGGMIGTLDYIAPEQIQGAPEVDYRADIYSLGIMAYQMLTGELPFQQNNPGALVIAHLMQPPPDPRAKVAAIPAAMARAVMRAMSKKPAERFATAGEMAAHFTPVPLSL